LREVEENTSRLLEGESEALDQQYKNLLAQMQEAIVKARETLVNTEYIREDFIKELESNLNKVGIQLQENLKQQSTEMASQYNNLLKDVRNDYLKQSEKQAEEFEKAAEAELTEFQKDLKKQTVNSEQEIESQVKLRFDQIQQELEAYRAEQMKKIAAQTNSILEDVTRKVLGQGLNLSEQEQLVMDSIETAKKENLFQS
jgi:exonuclease VII large subunit